MSAPTKEVPRAALFTEIVSNGSGYIGTVDDLLARLATATLDPTFEKYGNFVHRTRADGVTYFFGNFANYSHVFNINTNDPAVITPLRRAIRENINTAAYAIFRGQFYDAEAKRLARLAEAR